MRSLLFMALFLPGLALPNDLYQKHCAACHGADRLGGTGPALLPENLARLKKPEAAHMIRDSRPGVQMPAFGEILDEKQISGIVELIYSPLVPAPRWGEAEVRASRVLYKEPDPRGKPAFQADPLNLFVVVEAGDHHVTILDGDRLEPIRRFPSRYALHGGPKFSPDGRFVYFASRDGWITKYDLWGLETLVDVRAGINTRNAAVSADGKYVAVANYLPHSVVILDSNLQFVKQLATGSRVSAVYDAAPRKSFVVALKDIPEMWEISYDPKTEDVPVGLVHDFRLKEGAFVPGFLNARRTQLEDVLDDFFFTPDYRQVVGASRDGKRGQVVHLDVRRTIATLELPGLPHLGSGITWERDGARVMATPNLREGVVTVLDVATWKAVKQVPTLGPGFFLRSHEASRYAWVDSMMSPKGRDTLQVIDKQTLEVTARLRPEPGKTLAHIEFDRYGRYALASLWEPDGALIVFDAATLAEVKRIPMRKPVGKYNVANKILRSEGTSH
ncbi:MAG TPA: cytochrome D1 domain-containing protein [Burkholderiales bacterium]|nr:cytochrome D1 domain-containing protein [Burkholderiales bacterium]